MSTNFEAMQAAWKTCDRQLTTQKALSEKLIRSILRDRSGSTLTAISRQNGALALLFTGYTVFFVACIAGNAFDYTHPLAYIPLVVQGLTFLVCAVWLFKVYGDISHIRLSGDNLADGLRKVIGANERHLAVRRKLWWSYFIAGVAFPFTFLPRAIEHRGIAEALGFLAIPVAIVGVLVLLAKPHLFKDRKNESLKQNLQELEGYLAELEKA